MQVNRFTLNRSFNNCTEVIKNIRIMQEFLTNQISEPIKLYANTCESDKIT